MLFSAKNLLKKKVETMQENLNAMHSAMQNSIANHTRTKMFTRAEITQINMSTATTC